MHSTTLKTKTGQPNNLTMRTEIAHVSPIIQGKNEIYLSPNDENAVIQYLDKLLSDAVTQYASDVHIEPLSTHLRIRFRIDGVLQIVHTLPNSWAPRICARLKVMAKLDISERRLPQDGAFTLPLPTHQPAFRMAILPTQYGEKVVLRLQTTQHIPLSLEALGFNKAQLHLYLQALHKPQGLILVTGPTGSGKTITLYSGLQQLNASNTNICSIEDPIEIPLDGVNQTAINPKIGLTFQHTLRALLRQDPDVLMIGEIRDAETAHIAVRAAHTGHRVLSTLHTLSACEAIFRLEQMGVPISHLASAITLILSQRLVRRLCSHCKQPAKDYLFKNKLVSILLKNWSAVGCQQCCGGYLGRIAIYELLPITPELQHNLVQGVTLQQLRDLMARQEILPLFTRGLHLVEQGITSLDELFRTLESPT